jgi:SPP1 family predicted phage head-tail adaptor
MIQPGKLRYPVIIQKLVGTLDAAGQEVLTWQTHGTRWASIEPLQGRELLSARLIQSEVTTRIRLRYLAGVKAKMRVLFGSRVFDIQDVINPEERNIELQLMCIERV